MCGIAGIIGNDTYYIRNAVARMNSFQLHRGPDGKVLEVLEFGENIFIGLGHRRLSIIVLSPKKPGLEQSMGDVCSWLLP